MNGTTITETFATCDRLGFRVCDIPPGGKRPLSKAWNAHGNWLTQAPQNGHGLGLLHAWSSTCAVDVDSPDAGALLALAGVDLQALIDAPDACAFTSGKPGRLKLLYKVPPFVRLITEQVKDDSGVMGYELRCWTKGGKSDQDVLPPSMHPDTGKSYFWLKGGLECIPQIPAALMQHWVSLNASSASKAPSDPSKAANDNDGTPCSDERFQEECSALDHLDPDMSHEEWIKAGAAFKGTGHPKAAEYFDVWSSKATRPGAYRGTTHTMSQWASFDTSRVSLKSLSFMAREAGWTQDASSMFGPVAVPAGDGHPLARYREFTGTIKAPAFVLPYLIPAKGLTVIAGAPGSGKTTNVLPLIAATAWCCPADHPMRAARPRRVVVISEDVEQVEQVLQAMVLKGFCTREQVSDMIKVVEAQRMPAARIVEARDEWRKLTMTHTNDRGQPVELLPLIVLDTTSSALDLESENDNAEVSRNIATLKQGLSEFPIVVIAHTSKLLKGRTTAAELAIRGASAFEGDSNKTLFMVVEDDGSRYLLHGKSRFEIPQDKQEVRFQQFTTTVPVFADFGMEMVTLRCSLAEFARAADRAGDKAAAAADRKRAEASANQQRIETEILKFLTDEYADGRGVNGTGLKKAVKCGNDVRQAAITHLLETGRAAKWYPPDSFYTLGGCKKGNPLLVATTPDEQAAWQSNGGNMPAAMQAREDRERLDSS